MPHDLSLVGHVVTASVLLSVFRCRRRLANQSTGVTAPNPIQFSPPPAHRPSPWFPNFANPDAAHSGKMIGYQIPLIVQTGEFRGSCMNSLPKLRSELGMTLQLAPSAVTSPFPATHGSLKTYSQPVWPTPGWSQSAKHGVLSELRRGRAI